MAFRDQVKYPLIGPKTVVINLFVISSKTPICKCLSRDAYSFIIKAMNSEGGKKRKLTSMTLNTTQKLYLRSLEPIYFVFLTSW